MWHENLLSVDKCDVFDLKVVIFDRKSGHFGHFPTSFCLDFDCFYVTFMAILTPLAILDRDYHWVWHGFTVFTILAV